MSALRSSATRYESSSARTRSSSCLRERTPRSVGVWEIHALEKILHQLCTFSPEGSGVDWRNKLQRERGNGVLRPVLLVERRKALTDLQLHDLAVFQNRLAIPQESASPFFGDLSPLHLSPRVSAMLPLPSNQTGRTARFASTESDFCNAPAFSRRPRTVELSNVLQALAASRCAQDLICRPSGSLSHLAWRLEDASADLGEGRPVGPPLQFLVAVWSVP